MLTCHTSKLTCMIFSFFKYLSLFFLFYSYIKTRNLISISTAKLVQMTHQLPFVFTFTFLHYKGNRKGKNLIDKNNTKLSLIPYYNQRKTTRGQIFHFIARVTEGQEIK